MTSGIQDATAISSKGMAPAPPRFPLAILLLVWLLVIIVATLVTFILPESYSSTARIKVERDQPDIQTLAGGGAAAGYDPHFMQTEFELLCSEPILSKVTEQLDLNREWGKKYANNERLKTPESMALLKNRIDLRPVRNTSLIEIRVYSEKPDEAATIANAIAEAYRDHRQERRRRMISASIEALEQAADENSKTMQSLRTHLAELSQSKGDSNRAAEVSARLDDMQRFGQMLFGKIMQQKADLILPASGMVEIVDRAVPGVRPVRPNKPLNIALGIIIGGLAGLFLSTLVYVLQHREFRRRSGVPRGAFPPRFRAIVHILIALVVGLVVGYLCASPLNLETIIILPLTLLFGGIASAYLELARPAMPTTATAESPAGKTTKA